MGLDWSKSRRRQQGHISRRAEIDDARYVAELDRPPQRRQSVTLGPGTLKCHCGHSGRVNTALHKRFRCSNCGKLWWM
jgi:hypothetical protein